MRKFFSILFAMLVLMLSLNLALLSHFCQEELYAFKLVYGNGDAGCGMECSLPVADFDDNKETIQKSACCLDVKFDILSDSFIPVQSIHSLQEVASLATLVYTDSPFEFPRFQKNFFPDTYPDFTPRVFLSMIQVYLI